VGGGDRDLPLHLRARHHHRHADRTVTPPVGLHLYIASAISRVPVPRVVVWPFVGAMTAVLILIVALR
jgi:hypothetical protein